VQKLAVVLREPHDRGVRAGCERRERRERLVLRLLDVGVDGPAVRAALRAAEALVDALDHLVAERVAELVCALVRLVARVAHEVGQQPLDDPVPAHDALGPGAAGLRQERLLALPALDEAVGLEPLEHLAGRRARDAEHLGDTRGERGRPGAVRGVLTDRKGEEIDRLEVLVDGVTVGHLRLYCPRESL
jgi:hypothetical protein